MSVKTKTLVIVTCDRCGEKEEYFLPDKGEIPMRLKVDEKPLDLCADCTKSFHDWVGGLP